MHIIDFKFGVKKIDLYCENSFKWEFILIKELFFQKFFLLVNINFVLSIIRMNLSNGTIEKEVLGNSSK